ncbi:MAG TPA: CoA transferase [Hyphomicrobiaceae bacterium]|nr:CoA transferase [Hyphomicrobiaceae bacterium]
MSTLKAPLAGIRILDLTQFLSGPFGTQILGDLGADVIKVEAPDGDITRRLPPHFVAGDSCYFHSINRNKRSIAIDLKSKDGQALLRRLALECDVVIENWRPGVMARLGLDYSDLVAERPALISCSISGFGQDGPYRDRPAYDMIAQALSGGMSMTGEPGGRPVRSGIPLGDLAGGLYGVIGILAAIIEARASGKGRFIDVSMLDCQIAMLTYQAAYHLKSGTVPGLQGAAHDSIPTYRTFTAADGRDVVVCANTERMWQGLARALGKPELIEEPLFKTNELRHQNRASLLPILEAAFRTAPAATWVERLQAEEIPTCAVNTVADSLADSQVRHRGMVLTLKDRDGTPLTVAGDPLKLRDAAGRLADQPANFPPKLNQDANGVLSELLGLSSETIADLHRTGVIGARTAGKA